MLDNVFAKSPVLWVVGLVTAVGTAYYMTRLFYLTFYGEARWQQPAPDGRPAHHTPHESPWVMRIPLIVLAVGAAFWGFIDLPINGIEWFNNWLDPVFAGSLYNDHERGATVAALSTTDAVAAVAGLTIAWMLWRVRADRPELEPRFLQRVWYWDDFYDAVIGRPGAALARFSATVVESRVIDAAVNGVGTLTRRVGSGARRLQTGYVRNYALGIALGLAAFLVFMVSRTWWS